MPETFACQSCGQLIAICEECPHPFSARWCPCGRALCENCKPAYGKDDFHEVVKLFEAPKTMPGQMTLE